MFRRKNHLPPEATYREVWKKGDAATKASFFLMGISQLKNRQWVKGTAYLVSEVVFLLWLMFSGTSDLKMLSNLGAVKTKQVVFDQAQGVYITKLPDNSVLILLFGIMALILMVAMVGLYIANLRSVRKLYVLHREQQHVPTNREELASLLDTRLHTTLLTLPILGII
ncbi:MAG: sugar ABC transporter permease, partial [Lacticaseibacillus paracasei]